MAVGTAVIALALLCLASLGLMALAIAAIAVDVLQPTDFAMGQVMGTIGLIIWTPVAMASALALRWLLRWRSR